MDAAVVKLHLCADNHLTGFLRVEAKLNARPVWKEERDGGDASLLWIPTALKATRPHADKLFRVVVQMNLPGKYAG